MKKERVGFALCGSFCTHDRVLEELELEKIKQQENTYMQFYN